MVAASFYGCIVNVNKCNLSDKVAVEKWKMSNVSVVTSPVVNVTVTSSVWSFASERHFPKDLTVAGLKASWGCACCEWNATCEVVWQCTAYVMKTWVWLKSPRTQPTPPTVISSPYQLNKQVELEQSGEFISIKGMFFHFWTVFGWSSRLKCKLWGTRGPRCYTPDWYRLLITVAGDFSQTMKIFLGIFTKVFHNDIFIKCFDYIHRYCGIVDWPYSLIASMCAILVALVGIDYYLDLQRNTIS